MFFVFHVHFYTLTYKSASNRQDINIDLSLKFVYTPSNWPVISMLNNILMCGLEHDR